MTREENEREMSTHFLKSAEEGASDESGHGKKASKRSILTTWRAQGEHVSGRRNKDREIRVCGRRIQDVEIIKQGQTDPILSKNLHLV
jgi:hypothetical protein